LTPASGSFLGQAGFQGGGARNVGQRNAYAWGQLLSTADRFLRPSKFV
jgi:hypothetical protein